MSTDGSPRDDGKSQDVASLTLKILGQIRDQAQETNAQLQQTNARLEQTNTRLDAGFERLDRRIDETNTRLDATNMCLMATNVHLGELTRATIGGFHEVNRRIDNVLLGEHRDEHLDLRRRVERLERQAGLDEPLGPEGH